jgi:rhodanese-related sulfurtransferase
MTISKQIILTLFILIVAVKLNAKDISQVELQTLMNSEEKPLLIDVRSEDEYADGHIAGAINIPYKELEQRLEELLGAKDSQIILYCRSGRRAGIAKETLEQNGFMQLDHLSGDFIAWHEKGLPSVK